MPAIIAILLRQVIMSIATGAVVTGAQELLDGTAKELVNEIKDKEGLTEKDAIDVVGNIFIDLAINSASIFAVLKTGLGVKAAEFLGLTSKGFAKKALTGKAAQVATKLATEGGKKAVLGAMPKILKILAVPGSFIWLASALANIIEPGIYKPEQTNALYKKLGIPFQYPTSGGQRKAGLLEATDFTKLAEALESAGIKGISNPVAQQSQLYSRDGLADVIDYVTGKAVLEGKKATASAIRPLIEPYLISDGKSASAVASSSGGSTKVSVAPITKVFTGIVSQGVVGPGLSFTPRPDDLIESAAELREAAANNLAPFLNTLLGKVVYEVKVVSSIITKEGFRQSGTTQQIPNGFDSSGRQKYKSVTNKFATLVVYALTDKGSRAKLTTIVLGPTNSAKLTVGQNDLRTLETQLPALVTTNDINEIKGIETAAPITITTPPPKAQEINQVVDLKTVNVPSGAKVIEIDADAYKAMIKNAKEGSGKQYKGEDYIFTNGNLIREKDNTVAIPDGAVINRTAGNTPVPATAPVVTTATPTTPKAGANASTLSEWYQAQGQSLPSVSARSQIYAGFGLGQASYYAGTAEQNTKLLQALKLS